MPGYEAFLSLLLLLMPGRTRQSFRRSTRILQSQPFHYDALIQPYGCGAMRMCGFIAECSRQHANLTVSREPGQAMGRLARQQDRLPGGVLQLEARLHGHSLFVYLVVAGFGEVHKASIVAHGRLVSVGGAWLSTYWSSLLLLLSLLLLQSLLLPLSSLLSSGSRMRL